MILVGRAGAVRGGSRQAFSDACAVLTFPAGTRQKPDRRRATAKPSAEWQGNSGAAGRNLSAYHTILSEFAGFCNLFSAAGGMQEKRTKSY
jgi:hypothetical protein